MLTDKQIRDIRSRFKIFQSKVYLNTCSQGALSDAVEAGFDEFIASWHPVPHYQMELEMKDLLA